MINGVFPFLLSLGAVVLVRPDARGQAHLAIPWEYRVPKARLIEEVTKLVPETIPLEDIKAGNKLIYRDVRLNKLQVTGAKPKLVFEGPKLKFDGVPTVKGDLYLLYEHVVIEWPVRRIARVFGRDIKQSVPVEKREWRRRSNPFGLTAGVEGTIDISIVGDKCLNNKRIVFDLQCTESSIKKVDLNTGDGFRGLLNDIIAIGGGVPNSGPVNPLIRSNISRKIVIDPFVNESKETRERMSKVTVTDLSFVVEEKDVVLKAKLEVSK